MATNSFQLVDIPPKGKGPTANSSISPGTLIISEPPLVEIPPVPIHALDAQLNHIIVQ